ncbi:MAG: haloacid dehalogenase-like hydrolase [Nanoarchaeota archaeon]|nr:haloacid dehalogenase-like hydrolase [Nanoarchaeota archaeon]MBU1030628.1 haloacid dehalogenase-like hydrolase [Nanoarchaeota archaeon]MBU1849552.1 haloacid dehalogenase-like hydrolase [Nanoarchaeota archaeon]
MRKIAILDFDMTLSSRYITMDFLDYLSRNNLVSKDNYAAQIQVEKEYHAGKVSYDEWCLKFGDLWISGLKGKIENKILLAAESFYKDYKKQIYKSSYELINLLKTHDYHTVVLSTAASEVVNLAVKDLCVDEVFSSTLSKTKGVYDGGVQTDFHLPQGKKELTTQILQKYGRKNSFGFGDSSHDVEILSQVDFPVALNPNNELLKIAKMNDWNVFYHTNILSGVKKILDASK